MIREFVYLPRFRAAWEKLGLDDNDLRRLENLLLENPREGDVMQETGGIRKIRFAFPGRGKSGSTRVIYIDFAAYDKIYFLTAYAKKDQDNLTREERNKLRQLVEQLEKELERRI